MKGKARIKPDYAQLVKEASGKPKVLYNCFKAFMFGGALCAAAEYLKYLFVTYSGLLDKDAAGAVLLIVIGLTALITGLGFYDSIALKFGAGIAVPISGFANSLTSAAMDSKSEGWVLGIASNGFKLAGAVIITGAVSALAMAILSWFIQVV